MERHIALDDEGVRIVRDAHRVVSALNRVAPAELTPLFYAVQYDNLTLVIRDLLRVLGADPDEPWPELPRAR